MSKSRVHDKLIASAAREILAPLGFQQKGRSRLWFADHGWWLSVVAFQPSGQARGSYLDVAAMWLWGDSTGWSFDFSFHTAARVNGFCEFENEDQFRLASRELARTAAAEAQRLCTAIPEITAVADLLRLRVLEFADPRKLYDAAVANYLADRRGEAVRLFLQLSVPGADDHPGAVWLHELRRTGGKLATAVNDGDRLFELLSAQIGRSRAALGLPVAEVSLPRGRQCR